MAWSFQGLSPIFYTCLRLSLVLQNYTKNYVDRTEVAFWLPKLLPKLFVSQRDFGLYLAVCQSVDIPE